MSRAPPAENPSRAYYDRIAASYDDQVETDHNSVVRDCFWQCADAALPPRSRILDFGAGSGTDGQHFAAAGHFIAAYDQSDGMLEQLKRRCAGEIRDGSIVPVGGSLDAAAPILQGLAPFDAAFSNFAVFSTVPELERVLELFAQLLRPGALLLIVIQNPWHVSQLKSAGFLKGLAAFVVTGSLRYRSPDLGLIHHHTPARIVHAAARNFSPSHRAIAPCRAACFGPRSFFRLIELVRR